MARLQCSAAVCSLDLVVRVACRWHNGPIYHPKVDQDGHGQQDHGRILINDAAKQQNPTSHRGYFSFKVAIDRAPGRLSIAGLKKKCPLQEVGFCCFAVSLIRILSWPCWSTFGCYIGLLCHLHAPQGPTHRTILQPSHQGHARLVRL